MRGTEEFHNGQIYEIYRGHVKEGGRAGYVAGNLEKNSKYMIF